MELARAEKSAVPEGGRSWERRTRPAVSKDEGARPWSLTRVLLATGGRLLTGPTRAEFGRIATDSRAIEQEDLFLALTGERFDGHDYLAEAVAKGAAGLIVSRRPDQDLPVPVILVEDGLRALGDLAAYRRAEMADLRVIAITGSCGKTTVKEMVAAILEQDHNIFKTQGNFNNLVGLPLSLLSVGANQDCAVLEMGMNVPGEIARLTEIADPDIACITNVQDAHLAGLGDIAGVARAKGELFAGARSWATLVVNLDDGRVRKLARPCRQKKTGFGRSSKAFVRSLRIRNLGEKGMRFTLKIGEMSRRLTIAGLGAHNVQNALAAAGIAHAAGVGFASIINGLEAFRPFEKRLQVQDLRCGARVLNDAYNANPSSMLAALETFRHLGGKGRKVVILGDMLELGPGSPAAHRKIGEAVARLGFDCLLTVGESAGLVVEAALRAGLGSKKAHHCADKAEVAAWLSGEIDAGRLGPGDWLLLKGSRGMRMETIIQDLLVTTH